MIQRIETGAFKQPVIKIVAPISEYYLNFPSPDTNKIAKIMEHNRPTNFYPLIEKG